MFYLVIGIVLVVVGVGAIIKQRSRHLAESQGEKQSEEIKTEETKTEKIGVEEARPSEPVQKAEDVPDFFTLSRSADKEQTQPQGSPQTATSPAEPESPG